LGENAAMTARKEIPRLAAFLDLRGKPVLVVGGGEVAARKAQALVECEARITVVAPALCERLAALAGRGHALHRAGRFEEADLAGMEMAIAATDDARVNEAVARAAQALRIPVNVADDAALSTFLMGATVERGPVRIAISTSGASPALARKLRARIEGAVPEAYGRLAAFAGRHRAQAIRRLPDPDSRRRFWERVMEGPIAALVLEGREDEARAALERELATDAAASTGRPR
jgi:uroporphyrin-III C-methyltransferase/precorrin-2 dehydrogenase/sirohydrochlorin ferrochelatase